MLQIALFDLDHTLIPFDTGLAWTEFLIERGVFDEAVRVAYLDHGRQYAAGTLDIREMQRTNVGALREVPPAEVVRWIDDFREHLRPRVPAATRTLVDGHRARGDLCAIVTATPRFLAEPLAALFEVPHLLASESAVDARGHLTGEVVGAPCFRAHKIDHVQRWLAGHGHGHTLQTVGRSWFYSDSANDLPLLEAVSDPVAVSPDARLRAQALARGWPVIELSSD